MEYDLDPEVTHVNLDGIMPNGIKWADDHHATHQRLSIVKEYVVETFDGLKCAVIDIEPIMEYIALHELAILDAIVLQYSTRVQPNWKIDEMPSLPTIGSVDELNKMFELKWHILFDKERMKYYIHVVSLVDGEHDLRISLGYNQIVKNVWIE